MFKQGDILYSIAEQERFHPKMWSTYEIIGMQNGIMRAWQRAPNGKKMLVGIRPEWFWYIKGRHVLTEVMR